MVWRKFEVEPIPAAQGAAPGTTVQRDGVGAASVTYLTVGPVDPTGGEGGEIHLQSERRGEGFHLDYLNGLFRVHRNGAVWLYAAGPVDYVDANGWYVDAMPGSKRVWRRRWIGVALPAAPDAILLSAEALPVGVATMGAVDSTLSHRALAFAARIQVAVEGGEGDTALRVVASSTDGANLNASTGFIDLFVTLVRR